MTTWLDPHPIAVPAVLRASIGGRPLVAQILAQRGFSEEAAARAFLDPGQYIPAPSSELPDMDAAASRIVDAIRRGETICVWGDFDVDGQTATTLLVSLLRELGAQVTFHIPVRAVEGHGVGVPVLAQFVDQGATLVVTCDTGIAAHEAVDFARQRGVDVVVTDHHDLPPTLPEALAVVNPKRLPESHPLATLPGVGVVYKLAEDLLRRVGRGEAHQQYLDLAALGIVADVALQTRDTRYLLQLGLRELRRPRRLGLQTMMELAGLNPEHLTEEHVAFTLAPRLNALGRLGDANEAVEFLTTSDLGRARVLATNLEGLNAKRQLLTRQVFQGALAQIERDPSVLEQAALVLSHPAWPAGVVGIVASQLVERYNRPTVLLAAPPGELARGSARSVEGVNITAAIADHAGMLAGFGGHPMAAGLSIDPLRIPAFRRALSQTIRSMRGDIAAEPALQIDGYLPLGDLSLDLVEDLERLAPFGPGNPAPVLATRNLKLVSAAKVGRDDEHRLVTVEDEQGTSQRAMWWNGADWPLPDGQFDLAYAVRASTYRGARDVQIEWKDARPVAEAAVEVRQPAVEIVDCRHEADQIALLKELAQRDGVAVWCEAEARKEPDGLGRHELAPADTLVIWTTPPGRTELQAALQRVSPRTVYVFGVDPASPARPEAFLAQLAGLAKHALNAANGRASLAALAAATTQRESTVRLGLDWLAERGFLRIVHQAGGEVWLEAGDGAAGSHAGQIAAQLKAALDEASAYRAFFARADVTTLL